MSIKQISVFVENKPGSMNAMTKVLADNNIDMRALSLAETIDFGIVRIIVDDVFTAATVLKDAGYVHTVTPVVGVMIPNSPGGLSTFKVRRHLKESMARLQTDHIELYFMHHIDRTTSWEEMWDVFEQLFRDGLIDYVGTSNHPAWYFTMGQEKANQRHFFGIAAEEHLYNLLTRQAELEVLPAAKKQGIAIMTYSPLAGGRLTKAGFENMKAQDEAGKLNPAQKKVFEQLKQFEVFCKDLGVDQEVAGLAWQVRNPYVTCPLIGVSRAEQIESSCKALEVKMTPEAMRQLDEIFPRVGEAPESYAW